MPTTALPRSVDAPASPPDLLARRALLAGALLALLSGCASVLGPRTVTFSREELMARLAKQFPLREQVLDVFEVTAAVPRLTMLPDANRVGAEFDLAAADKLFGRRYRGLIGLSFGLRFERSDLSIRLADVKVDRIQLADLPRPMDSYLTRLGAWLAEDRLQNYPIHRFKPEDLRTADRMGYQVEDLRVTGEGLSVHLAPRR